MTAGYKTTVGHKHFTDQPRPQLSIFLIFFFGLDAITRQLRGFDSNNVLRYIDILGASNNATENLRQNNHQVNLNGPNRRRKGSVPKQLHVKSM